MIPPQVIVVNPNIETLLSTIEVLWTLWEFRELCLNVYSNVGCMEGKLSTPSMNLEPPTKPYKAKM